VIQRNVQFPLLIRQQYGTVDYSLIDTYQHSKRMTLKPGQQVVWSYRPQKVPRRLILVDAEVVQYGQRRTRIRIHTLSDAVLFRWVHPKNLRPKCAAEPTYPYPTSQ